MRQADRDLRYHSQTSEDFLMESPAVAAHPLRLPSSFFLCMPVGAALGVSAFVLAATAGGLLLGPAADDRGKRRNIRMRAGATGA